MIKTRVFFGNSAAHFVNVNSVKNGLAFASDRCR